MSESRSAQEILHGFARQNAATLRLVLFLLIVTSVARTSIPLLVARLFDQGLSAGNLGVAESWLAMMALTYGLAIGSERWILVLNTRIGMSFTAYVRSLLLRGFLNTAPHSITKDASERFHEILSNSIYSLLPLFKSGPATLVRHGFVASLSLGAMATYSPWVTSIVIAVFVLPTVAQRYVQAAAVRQIGVEMVSIAALSALARNCFENVRTIKLLGAEERLLVRFTTALEGACRATLKREVLDIALQSVLASTFPLALGAALCVWLSDTDVSITPGVVIAYASILKDFARRVEFIGLSLKESSAFLHWIRTFTPYCGSTAEDSPMQALPSRKRSERACLRFDAVCFEYPGSDSSTALSEIDMTLEAGEIIALVGQSGSGKTTLLRLLCMQLDGYQGAILYNGTDLKEIPPRAWRGLIGVVPQAISILPGTLWDNIALGRQLAQRAMVDRVLIHLGESGLDLWTPGELDVIRIASVSDLEPHHVQILGFLRAIATNPAILILDESTSQMTPEHERCFLNALPLLTSTRITLLAAHRPAAINACTRVISLTDGRMQTAPVS